MFQFIKNCLKAFKPKPIHHSFFGQLHYFEFSDSSKNYYEGKLNLGGPLGEVEVYIDADNSGPSKGQESFCTHLWKNPNTLAESIKELLYKHFEEWTGKAAPKEFWQEFNCTGITIPINGDEHYDWDVSSASKTDKNHLFTVYFQNGKAKDVLIEG